MSTRADALTTAAVVLWVVACIVIALVVVP